MMTKVTQLSLDEQGGLNHRRIHLREISGDSESPLETVGDDLRTARLRRGDDLATVSKTLKIHKDYLDAVETGNLESLPGKTYAIGFVRSYATYLGLDTAQTVERFKQEIAGRHDEQRIAPAAIHVEDGRRLPNGWRIVGLIVVVVLGYGGWHIFSATPATQIVPPAPVLVPPHAETSANPKPAADAEKTTAGAAAADTAQTATGAPAADAWAPAGTPAEKSAASVAPGKDAAPVIILGAAQPPETAQNSAGHVYGSQNRASRVILRARGDTHITVHGANNVLYMNRNLKAGDSYQLPDVPGLFLTTSDAGALEVDLDGLAMGRAGGEAQSGSNIGLDPQAIVDRYNGGR